MNKTTIKILCLDYLITSSIPPDKTDANELFARINDTYYVQNCYSYLKCNTSEFAHSVLSKTDVNLSEKLVEETVIASEKHHAIATLLAFIYLNIIDRHESAVNLVVPRFHFDILKSYLESNSSVFVLNKTICHSSLSFAVYNSRLINQTKIHKSSQSEIYKIKVGHYTYAIKLLNNTCSDSLLFFLNHNRIECSSLAHVFLAANTSLFSYKSIIISEYIDGCHIHGLLEKHSESCLNNTILDLNQQLINYENTNVNSLQTVEQKIEHCLSQSKDKNITKLGKTLLNIWKSNYIQRNYYICLYDLHRDNLLFCEDSSWRIVDTESIVLGTNTFTFSCLLAASYLFENYNPQFVIDMIPRQMKKDLSRICLEIIIRLYIGISFFSVRSQIDNSHDMLEKYLYVLILFLEHINICNYLPSQDINSLLLTIKGCQ